MFAFSNFDIGKLQFWIKIQIWKDKNQNFEQDFKILDRNKAEITHRWNKENLMKLDEKIVY